MENMCFYFFLIDDTFMLWSSGPRSSAWCDTGRVPGNSAKSQLEHPWGYKSFEGWFYLSAHFVSFYISLLTESRPVSKLSVEYDKDKVKEKLIALSQVWISI